MTNETKERLEFIANLSIGSSVSVVERGNGVIMRRSKYYRERPWLVRYENGLVWCDAKMLGREDEYKAKVSKNAKAKNATA